MDGFFSKSKVENASVGKNLTCVSCGLFKHCQSPKMEPAGNFKKGIMNIGEFPNRMDDRKGLPLQGKEGRILKKTYAKYGIDLWEDCININAIKCHPGKEPTPHNINACRKYVLDAIKKYKPKVIVLLGKWALVSVIGYRWKKDLDGIEKWRGFTIPDQDFMAWVCPTYAPYFVANGEEVMVTVFEQDIKRIASVLKKKVPVNTPPVVEFLKEDELGVLDTAFEAGDMFPFDYETTGLKPYTKGHRIVCAAVADTDDHAWAFMMPSSKKKRKPFTDLLENRAIDKMAHNMKFEHNWTKVRLKTTVDGWKFDSMLAAHIIDNRPGITGLKFQTYVNFGVVDYDSDVAPYLKAVDGTANGFNKVTELIKRPEGAKKLLTYCGYDTIYERRLALKQMKQMNYDFYPF